MQQEGRNEWMTAKWKKMHEWMDEGPTPGKNIHSRAAESSGQSYQGSHKAEVSNWRWSQLLIIGQSRETHRHTGFGGRLFSTAFNQVSRIRQLLQPRVTATISTLNLRVGFRWRLHPQPGPAIPTPCWEQGTFLSSQGGREVVVWQGGWLNPPSQETKGSSWFN